MKKSIDLGDYFIMPHRLPKNKKPKPKKGDLMAIHIFATFLTHHGTAANNRGMTEGNMTTLQKLVWNNQVHSTVSAEAIRFALRRRLADSEACNRTYDEDKRANEWKDPKFSKDYIDDDLLGFMSAKAATTEGAKGSALVRRAVLEVSRAVSLTPWPGDITFNAASPGATPSAQKGDNPVPYAAEMHATRYQYSIALTPKRLRKEERAKTALQALISLGEVAGNHGRFLFDFSPESVVFRITDDPAPRILYCFEMNGHSTPGIPGVIRKVRAKDIDPSELVLGGSIVDSLSDEDRKALAGATLLKGVKAACEEVCKRLQGKTS